MFQRALRFFSWFWVFPLIALIGVMLWALNFTYPFIGHDYLLFLPKLLAGKWHFVRQGFAPFRFSPHFCGGLPMYGNPQDMFYSLPQLFTLFMDPWKGIQLSIIIAMLLGYIGWYRFGRDVLRFSSAWAHLLSLTIISNGFFLLHMIVGHLTFHTVPLLGWFLWIIFDQTSDTRKTLLLRGSGCALLFAYALFAGYPIVLLFAVLATLLLLPFDLLLSEKKMERWRSLLLRIFTCSGFSLGIGASKAVAIGSFMRFFPRLYPFDAFTEKTASTLLFILRSFFYIPQGRFLFEPAGIQWGTHEYSMFLSPIVLIGLLSGGLLLYKRRSALRKNVTLTAFLAFYALFLTFFFTELTRGYGIIPDFLQALPLFKSLHVSSRFLYVFSLFVSGVGIFSLRETLEAWGAKHWERLCVGIGSLLTVVALPLAYLPLLQSPELQNAFQYEEVREEIHSGLFLNRPVTYVQDGKLDLEHVLDGTTAIHCFEPLFGYHGEYRNATLADGPSDAERDGVFNLLNPACFQYPGENRCVPGDRIPLADRSNRESFEDGKPVTWTLSTLQMWADRLTVITLSLSFLFVILALWKRMGPLWKRYI